MRTKTLLAGLYDLVDSVTQSRIQVHRIARELDLVLVCRHDRGENGQYRIGTCQLLILFDVQCGVIFKIPNVLAQFFLSGIQILPKVQRKTLRIMFNILVLKVTCEVEFHNPILPLGYKKYSSYTQIRRDSEGVFSEVVGRL